MKHILSLVILILFIAGCDAADFVKQPEVTGVSPDNGSVNVASDTVVKVAFSHEMDRVKTNESFSLSAEDSGDVDGFFAWSADGKELTFTPRQGLTSSHKYTIRVSIEAEDTNGSDLKDELVSSFRLNNDSQAPSIERFSPAADSTGNLTNTAVTIVFSEAVDLNTIYDGINISPAVEGYFSWNASMTEITFTPLYGYNYGVTYTVDVSESVRDTSGIKLRNPRSFSFTVGDDFVKPEIIRVYQNLPVSLDLDQSLVISGCEKNYPFVIEFSEIINTENLASSISFSPSVNFYVTTSNISGYTVATVNFTEDLNSEEVYTLNISDSVCDMQNNELVKSYRYRFITDGTNSQRPVVTAIGDSIGGWPIGEVKPLLISGSLYDNISVEFSREMNPVTLSIDVRNVSGKGSSPEVVNIQWDSTRKILTFGIDGVSSVNTYKIVIDGGSSGLADSTGNRMKEDFVQIIEF